jgi:hypothetical protein
VGGSHSLFGVFRDTDIREDVFVLDNRILKSGTQWKYHVQRAETEENSNIQPKEEDETQDARG